MAASSSSESTVITATSSEKSQFPIIEKIIMAPKVDEGFLAALEALWSRDNSLIDNISRLLEHYIESGSSVFGGFFKSAANKELASKMVGELAQLKKNTLPSITFSTEIANAVYKNIVTILTKPMMDHPDFESIIASGGHFITALFFIFNKMLSHEFAHTPYVVNFKIYNGCPAEKDGPAFILAAGSKMLLTNFSGMEKAAIEKLAYDELNFKMCLAIYGTSHFLPILYQLDTQYQGRLPSPVDTASSSAEETRMLVYLVVSSEKINCDTKDFKKITLQFVPESGEYYHWDLSSDARGRISPTLEKAKNLARETAKEKNKFRSGTTIQTPETGELVFAALVPESSQNNPTFKRRIDFSSCQEPFSNLWSSSEVLLVAVHYEERPGVWVETKRLEHTKSYLHNLKSIEVQSASRPSSSR